MAKLNQVIAAEKGAKTRASRAIDETYKAIQKGGLFQGLSRTYRPKDEEGEQLPPERTKVQLTAENQLQKVASEWADLYDVEATKDFANCVAKADVKVGETVLVPGAPVPFLLWLEKQLVDFLTFVGKLPTLDPAEEWTPDGTSGVGVWRSALNTTHRTKKEPRVITLAPPTEQHPAQVTLVQDDVLEGYWDTIKFSGGVGQDRIEELTKRASDLLKAVKMAREEANGIEAEPVRVGQAVMDYLTA